MADRYVRLWYVLLGVVLVAMILAGLTIGLWRDGERFKFSLGTLMIATALVAMFCGSVVYVINILDVTR